MARIRRNLAKATARLDRYEGMKSAALLTLFTAITMVLFVPSAVAKEYPIFDGRHYNGLYYPRIQVIEWDKPEYLVFNIYSKDKPVDVSGEVIKRGANKIFQFQYDLTHRDEKVCRSVIAPPNWKVGQRLNFFIDKKDPEMDQIYVSAQNLDYAPYKTPEFTNCKSPEQVAEKEAKKEPVRQPASSEREATPADLPVWYDDKPKTYNKYEWYK